MTDLGSARPDTAVCLVSSWRHRPTGTRVSLVNDHGQPVVVGIDPPLRGRPPLAWCEGCDLILIHPAAPDHLCRHLLAAFAAPPMPDGRTRAMTTPDTATAAAPAAARQVPAGALAVAVSHIAVAQAILAGWPPAEAFEASYSLFFTTIVPAMTGVRDGHDTAAHIDAAEKMTFPRRRPTAAWLADRHGGLAPRPSPAKRWTTACFTEACTQNAAALRMDPARYARATGWDDPPIITLPAAQADRLAWLMDMLRVYASGGGGHDLCAAARIALDHAAGKPRQRRAPVAADWLRSQVDEALDHAWDALRAAAPGLRR